MKGRNDRIWWDDEERFASIFAAPSFVTPPTNYRRAMKCEVQTLREIDKGYYL